jgi:hemolysin-activating ACP:hemolysin acyltransferase
MASEAPQEKAKKKANPKTNGSLPDGEYLAVNGDVAVEPSVAKIQIDALRTKIQLSIGQIVLLMANLPRYRNQTLADLSHLVLEPLLRDRISIATARPKESTEVETIETLAGVAIWASVSDAVDSKIREQITAGSFPIRLGTDDWVSGEMLWLLDIVSTDRKLATAVLANFSQVAGERPVNIHPFVSRSVDPEILDKLRSRNESDSL